ncbi:MAG: c-type cytochrome [Kofleriaceae bacterium]
MTKLLAPALVLAIAACGGSKPAPAPTTPVAEQTEPAPAPAEPVETAPAEPAEPPAPDPAQVKAELLAAETAAYEKAKPVFVKYCASCHQKGGRKANKKNLDHFDMTSYPLGGHHAAEIGEEVREVLGIGGGKPTMPAGKPGSVKGEELALIAAWVDAFEAARAGGAH